MHTPCPMRRNAHAVLFVLAVAVSPDNVAAQAPASSEAPTLAVAGDTSMRQLIRLRDGSTVLGHITQSWGDSARVESMAGVLMLRRASVASVKLVRSSSIHDGVYWPDDPNATRLFFGPTGRMLRKGDGYLANHWLFLMDGYKGITDRFTLGGAMTLIPSNNFLKNNVYFISPKVAITQSERLNTAVGVWAGTAPFSDAIGSINTFGIAYGVATWGGNDGALTLGGGYGFAEGKAARNPMVMFGGTRRLSRRLSFVTENWLFPNTENPLVSAGLRAIGENVSWDLGFFAVLDTSDTILAPWIGVAWKF